MNASTYNNELELKFLEKGKRVMNKHIGDAFDPLITGVISGRSLIVVILKVEGQLFAVKTKVGRATLDADSINYGNLDLGLFASKSFSHEMRKRTVMNQKEFINDLNHRRGEAQMEIKNELSNVNFINRVFKDNDVFIQVCNNKTYGYPNEVL